MTTRRLKPALLAGAAATVLGLSAPASADTLRDALNGAYRTNPTLQAARAQQRLQDDIGSGLQQRGGRVELGSGESLAGDEPSADRSRQGCQTPRSISTTRYDRLSGEGNVLCAMPPSLAGK